MNQSHLDQLISIKYFGTGQDLPQLVHNITEALDHHSSAQQTPLQSPSPIQPMEIENLCYMCFVAADILRSRDDHSTALQLLSKAKIIVDRVPTNIKGMSYVSLGLAKYSIESRQSSNCIRHTINALALAVHSNDVFLIASSAFLVFGLKRFVCENSAAINEWIELQEALPVQLIDTHIQQITDLLNSSQTHVLEWALSLIRSFETQQQLSNHQQQLDLHAIKVDISTALAERSPPQAIELLKENIIACDTHNDYFGKGNVLVVMASNHPDPQESLNLLEEALECFSTNNRRVVSMANVQWRIGKCYAKMGKLIEVNLLEHIKSHKCCDQGNQQPQQESVISMWKAILSNFCFAKSRFECAIGLFEESNRKHGKTVALLSLAETTDCLAGVAQICLEHSVGCDTCRDSSQCIFNDLRKFENEDTCSEQEPQGSSIVEALHAKAMNEYIRCQQCVETNIKQDALLSQRIDSEIEKSRSTR